MTKVANQCGPKVGRKKKLVFVLVWCGMWRPSSHLTQRQPRTTETRGVIRPDDDLWLELLQCSCSPSSVCWSYILQGDIRTPTFSSLKEDFSVPIPNWVALLFIEFHPPWIQMRCWILRAARDIPVRPSPRFREADFPCGKAHSSRGFIIIGAGGCRATVAAPPTKRGYRLVLRGDGMTRWGDREVCATARVIHNVCL